MFDIGFMEILLIVGGLVCGEVTSIVVGEVIVGEVIVGEVIVGGLVVGEVTSIVVGEVVVGGLVVVRVVSARRVGGSRRRVAQVVVRGLQTDACATRAATAALQGRRIDLRARICARVAQPVERHSTTDVLEQHPGKRAEREARSRE